MKYFYLYIVLIALHSCCQTSEKKEVISEPIIECSAWEIINQQSDTLPETGYSLFNHYKTNQKILEEQFDDYSANIRYRVGHKRYVEVLAVGLHKTKRMGCIWIGLISIDILNDNRLLVGGDLIEMDNLSEVFFEKYLKEENPVIELGIGNCSQAEILKVYDQIAIGYLKALNLYAHDLFQDKFCHLNQAEKDLIIKEHPLRFFDFVDKDLMMSIIPSYE